MYTAIGLLLFVMIVALVANSPLNAEGGAVSPPPPPAAPAPSTPSGSTDQSSGSVSPGSSSGAVGSPGATPAPSGTVQPLGTPPAQQAAQAGTPAPAGPPADWQQRLAQVDALRAENERYKQFEHLIPLGYRVYTGQLGQAGQPAGQQPATPTKNIFGLESFDYGLLNFVAKDPHTGQLVPIPGAPPDAVHKIQTYQQQLAEVQKNFWAEPEKFLMPMIQEAAKKIAQEQFQSQYGTIEQQRAAQSILQTNREWLYEKDAQGQPMTRFDPATGQQKPVLSQWGQYYTQLVVQAHRMGITDSMAQHNYAIAQVENAAFRLKQQQAAAPQQQQQNQQQFVQQIQQPLAATLPAPSTIPPPPPAEMSLRDQMLNAFKKHGLMDDVVLNQQLSNPTRAS